MEFHASHAPGRSRHRQRILLTTPYGPYDLAWGTDPLDSMNARLARGHGVFGWHSHQHAFGLYLIAENLDHPVTVLENPRWEDFLREIESGYDIIGIQLKSIAMPKVARMLEAVAERAPQAIRVVGGYGVGSLGQPVPGDGAKAAATVKRLAHHLCRDEGVRFMRQLLGDPPLEGGMSQRHIPRAGASCPNLLPFEFKYPLFLVGLGCPTACDFCGTSAFFRHKKIKVAEPEQIYRHMRARSSGLQGRAGYFGLFDEDIFIEPEFVRELGRLIRSDRRTWHYRWFGFGSIRTLSPWEPEELRSCGAGSLWIGVESFVQSGCRARTYAKLQGTRPVEEIFDGLSRCGISTVGSMILGLDEHTPDNIGEDIERFIALRPTFYQIAPLTPCPGTRLYSRLLAEGRIMDHYQWSDGHIWKDGVYRLANFENGAIKPWYDRAYEALAMRNGPPILQMLEINLRAFETFRNASDPFLRFHGEQSRNAATALRWTLEAVRVRPPSPEVLARAESLEQMAQSLLGKGRLIERALTPLAHAWFHWRMRNAKPVGPRGAVSDMPVRWSYYGLPGRDGPLVLRKRAINTLLSGVLSRLARASSDETPALGEGSPVSPPTRA